MVFFKKILDFYINSSLHVAFSAFALGETEEWVKSDKYMDYPEYQDEEYTYILTPIRTN